MVHNHPRLVVKIPKSSQSQQDFIIIIIIIHEFHRDASIEQNFRAAISTNL